jgi:uncharacterized protein
MRDEIINAIIKYVRINILKYTGLRVSWFGGEPSLEIDTICKMSETFLEICKKTKRAYWANITSNGYLINNDNFERLYKAHVFHFQITIDGIQRTHDSQRILTGGEGSFTQIIKNLIDIKNNKRFTHWNITIRTNFSKTIYDVIDEYIDYYYELFNDDSRFSFLFRPAGDWGGTVVKGYKENMLDNNGLSQVLEKMLNNNKLLNIERHLSFLNPGGSMCIAGMKNTFLIDSKGGIRKCSCHLDDDRNLIGQVSINGNFEIDKRKMNEWSFFELEKKCEECDFLPACINNACPANYVLKRGDTKECHVYEKCCLDYILKIINRQGKVEEILI